MSKDHCEPLEHLLSKSEERTEFAEEISDGGERTIIAENQQEKTIKRKRIRTG
ncbi:hypothetical protein ACFFHM_19210 [Halalkalibacter kiskunsagensis]|uniref:Uncharacterized protein n=1 Tax=Halalkalibacter kiskunsagensis TaxID=1548599 RepID=A0ABV6KGW1_9BACI